MPGRRHVWVLAGLSGLLAAGLLGNPLPASGQNLQLGPFRLLPSLELTGEYNDNIVLAPRNETKDFIYTISPGLALELPGRRLALRLAYRADILRFVDQDQLDTEYHTAQGEARLNFPGGLGLYVSDTFRRTADFAGFPVPDITSRVDRDENDLRAGAEYGLGRRFSVAVDYRHLLINFRDEPEFDDLDRQDQIVGATLFWLVLPKTSLLVEYNYQIIRYDLAEVAQDRDSDAHKIKVGAKGDLTAKTSVLVKVGLEDKNYDNPARQDWTGPIVEAELLYKYAEPSQIRLFGARANIESSFAPTNFFIATYGGVEIRHHFSPKLIGRVSGLVGINEYDEVATVAGETKERSDNFYEFKVGLLYQIQRWLAVEVAYAYLVRDSNFDDFDYSNNRVQATVRFTL